MAKGVIFTSMSCVFEYRLLESMMIQRRWIGNPNSSFGKHLRSFQDHLQCPDIKTASSKIKELLKNDNKDMSYRKLAV